MLGLSLPVFAAEQPGTISGYVRNVTGTPQMGAVVQILGSAHRTFTVFTDAAGFYSAPGLVPGLYSLKVTAPSFLPALREKVGLTPGGSLNINVTLSTLLGVMQLGPIRSLPDDDDWKWTLRSVANRPILRVFNDPTIPAEKVGPRDARHTVVLRRRRGKRLRQRLRHEHQLHARALDLLRRDISLSVAM